MPTVDTVRRKGIGFSKKTNLFVQLVEQVETWLCQSKVLLQLIVDIVNTKENGLLLQREIIFASHVEH